MKTLLFHLRKNFFPYDPYSIAILTILEEHETNQDGSYNTSGLSYPTIYREMKRRAGTEVNIRKVYRKIKKLLAAPHHYLVQVPGGSNIRYCATVNGKHILLEFDRHAKLPKEAA